jgi:hypothetical protein
MKLNSKGQVTIPAELRASASVLTRRCVDITFSRVTRLATRHTSRP